MILFSFHSPEVVNGGRKFPSPLCTEEVTKCCILSYHKGTFISACQEVIYCDKN